MSITAQRLTMIVNLLAAVNVLVLTRRLRQMQEQAWFWTPTWLAGEMEAQEDIATGRTVRYLEHEDFIKALMEIEHTRPEEDPRAFAPAM